jgi:hypothetical protein
MGSNKRGVTGFKPKNKMQTSETKPDEADVGGMLRRLKNHWFPLLK